MIPTQLKQQRMTTSSVPQSTTPTSRDWLRTPFLFALLRGKSNLQTLSIRNIAPNIYWGNSKILALSMTTIKDRVNWWRHQRSMSRSKEQTGNTLKVVRSPVLPRMKSITTTRWRLKNLLAETTSTKMELLEPWLVVINDTQVAPQQAQKSILWRKLWPKMPQLWATHWQLWRSKTNFQWWMPIAYKEAVSWHRVEWTTPSFSPLLTIITLWSQAPTTNINCTNCRQICNNRTQKNRLHSLQQTQTASST